MAVLRTAAAKGFRLLKPSSLSGRLHKGVALP